MYYAKFKDLLSFDLTRFDNVWRMSHLAAPALHVSTFWVAKKWNPSLVTPCHKKELWRITRPKVVEKRPCMEKWCLKKTSLPTLAMITTPFPKVKGKHISENNNFHPWLLSLLWIECIAEELTGTLGIYPEITWPVSILRPDVVQDEMIPRPKIAWSPCRKVTFGKSLLQFSWRRRIIWLKSFPNLSLFNF